MFMKIVIATPLFPPDIGGAASYVKELARRLAENYEVVVVAYGHLPEEVPGVSVMPINKHYPLLIRLASFFFALRKAAHDADALFIENGPSVELPAGIVSLITAKPIVVHRGDTAAHERTQHHILLRIIERFILSQARAIIVETPLPRPEILPFKPKPKKEFETYENSWKKHLDLITLKLSNVTR